MERGSFSTQPDGPDTHNRLPVTPEVWSQERLAGLVDRAKEVLMRCGQPKRELGQSEEGELIVYESREVQLTEGQLAQVGVGDEGRVPGEGEIEGVLSYSFSKGGAGKPSEEIVSLGRFVGYGQSVAADALMILKNPDNSYVTVVLGWTTTEDNGGIDGLDSDGIVEPTIGQVAPPRHLTGEELDKICNLLGTVE